MRNLIIRFGELGGPGHILSILQQKKEKITYHNAYDQKVQLIPTSHQIFDRLILLGGEISLIEQEKFLKKYIKLTEQFIKMNKQVLGVCLGSQILAKILGSSIQKSPSGLNIGFADFHIKKKTEVFNNTNSNFITAFSFHEDVFEIPKDAIHLLEYENSPYPNQMFSFNNNVFGLQCHLELTEELLYSWIRKKKEFQSIIKKKEDRINLFEQRKKMENSSLILFQNILSF